MMKRIGVLTVALLLCSALAALGQEEATTGSIEGRVVDPQGLPVPGATVTITSAQGTRTFITDTDGRFLAPFLTPATYTARIDLQGFRPVEQQNIQVRLGQRVTLPVTMQVAGVTAEVEVRGNAPTVNTSSTAIGANLDTELLSRIPIGRRLTDTLYIAPGVSSSGAAGVANPSVSGGSGLENRYIVDGTDITNAGYGGVGSYSIVFGSLGTGTPFDFIKEVQVKTGGYSAEFGQSTGGVVNVVTKSGSNDFSGSAFGYFRPEQLESDYRQIQTTNGTVNIDETRLNDGGGTIGGPILRNKIFFFGAIDPQWERTKFLAPQDFPLERLGPVARDRHIINYAGKGTWQISNAHRIDGSFFGDPSEGDNGPQRVAALLRTNTAGFSRIDKYGGHNQTGRYEGVLGSGWLVEASFARALNRIVEIPSVNEPLVTDRTVVPNVRSGGIGFFEVGNRGVNRQYQAKATNIIDTAAGQHQIRYGFRIDDIDYDNTINRTGPTFVLPNGQRTVTGAQIDIISDPAFGRIFRVSRANTSNVRGTIQRYGSVFAQDTWRIGERLTITPGLRWERQRLVGTLDDLVLDDNFAPRIGGAWDPTGQGRAKIFASWGRFYAQIPNDLAARALSADAGISRADYFDLALTQPIPDGVLAGNVTSHFQLAGASSDLIDPNVKSSYLNESVVGAEYEVFRGLNVGARWIRRRIGRALEDIQPFPAVACDFGIDAACDVEYTLTNPDVDTPTLGNLGARFEKPIHRYDEVEISAEKRYADRWGLQASYRWSRLEGTFEGFFRDDNGQSDPGITSLYDFPTDDPSYTAIGVPQFGYRGDIRFLGRLGLGPLPLDRPHQVKVYGNYSFPIGVNVGTGIFVSSGKPLTPFAAHPVYTNAGEIPEAPRGAGFQTADGFRTRSPWQYSIDAHADYSFGRIGRRRIVLLADAFNLFDQDRILDYNNFTETTFGTKNPDVGQPVFAVGGLPAFQTPRQIRLGARFEF